MLVGDENDHALHPRTHHGERPRVAAAGKDFGPCATGLSAEAGRDIIPTTKGQLPRM